MNTNDTPATVRGSDSSEGLGGWAKVPPEFNEWWNDDRLTHDNPFEEKTAAYWAWEGWQECKAVTLTDPDLRAGIALQIREIERLRAELAAVRAPLTDRERVLLDALIKRELDHASQCDGIQNRTMAERQKGWDLERVALLRKLAGIEPLNASLSGQPCCIKPDCEK